MPIFFNPQQGFLRVIVPADISRISGAEGIMEGGTATLKCEATGYPQPSVYWKREDKGQKIVILDRMTGRKKEGMFAVAWWSYAIGTNDDLASQL